MKKPQTYLSIIVILICTYLQSIRIQAQLDYTLPVDLLIEANQIDISANTVRSKLVKIDKTSLAMSDFYTEPSILSVVPLAWSPDHRLLAIYRLTEISFQPRQVNQGICILNRIGQLQHCFDVYIKTNPDRMFNQINTVSWSNDSRYVYFVNMLGQKYQLIQGEIITGQTNIITEYTYITERNLQLLWPQITRSYVIAHSGLIRPNDPNVVFHKLTSTGFAPISLAQLNTYLPQDICSQVSPIHGYLALVSLNGMNDSVMIINDQGNILFKIDENGGLGPMRLSCPSWSTDEQFFYLSGNADNSLNTTIFKYIPATQTIESFFTKSSDNFAEEESFSNSYPLAIYGNYTAGTSESDLNHQVNVVYPDKHTCGFRGTYDSTDNPLWIPELSVSPTATPTLVPTSTAGMVRLQYYPDPGRRSITVDSLEPDFRIMNPTNSAIPLSEFKIHYYFTKEGTSPLVFNCWYTSLPLRCNNITGTFVTLPTPVTGADTYLEVGFTGTTESVPANGIVSLWL